MMKPDFAPLAEALRERLAIIADHAYRDRDAAAHLQCLMEVSARIDALVSALTPEQRDPRFLHYLERRSYDKALAWIENSPECGPGATAEAGA